MSRAFHHPAIATVGVLIQVLVMPAAFTTLPASPASAEAVEGVGKAKAGNESDGEDEALATEHIFGFAQGPGIGSKGEGEIESISIGSFGKIGSYNQVDTETSLRYNVSNALRLSVGTLTDAYNIHDVPDINNRTAFDFSGVIAEARLNLIDDRTHPYGLSLSFDPQYRQFDPLSGARQGNTALPVSLLSDVSLIPSKLLAALNVVYVPSFFGAVAGGPGHNEDVVVLADLAYGVTPKLFLAGEVRHETLIQAGSPTAHALFLGPSVFYNVAPAFDVKVAWAIQVPDAGARSLDLDAFTRHQVELQLVYGF